ncbi:MAG: hypothetical protein KatS3mg070_2900 [Meiothermus sp.]|uniref:hypothetical protein n=1 Tax=Meiothermus sp. TaxID=1955249 RepID=UPI0021DBC5DD|nr:hypothetical protein [Meiothermus sp.]GIW29537.1 MAG: hypothetical protein KatS3mg070_2900 [Meiothermus sp.]
MNKTQTHGSKRAKSPGGIHRLWHDPANQWLFKTLLFIFGVGFVVTKEITAGLTGLFSKVYFAHAIAFAFEANDGLAKRYCNAFHVSRTPSKKSSFVMLSSILALFIADVVVGWLVLVFLRNTPLTLQAFSWHISIMVVLIFIALLVDGLKCHLRGARYLFGQRILTSDQVTEEPCSESFKP